MNPIEELYKQLEQNNLITTEDYSIDLFRDYIQSEGGVDEIYAVLEQNNLITTEDYSIDLFRDYIQSDSSNNQPKKVEVLSDVEFLNLSDEGQEQYMSDIGLTEDIDFGETFEDIKNNREDVIAHLNEGNIDQEVARRQRITDEAYKKGEGDNWLERRGKGLYSAYGNFLVDIEALTKTIFDKIGLDSSGVTERFYQNSKELKLLNAEIPSNLKQPTFAKYVDYKDVEVQVDENDNFKRAFDQEGFDKKVTKDFINDFNKSGVGINAEREVKVGSLAQSSEQMLYDVGVMLLGTKGTTLATKGAIKGLAKEARKKVVKSIGLASVGSTAFVQSYGDNYVQALDDFKGDEDKAANVAFQKSAITAAITTMFPGVETGGLLSTTSTKSVLNNVIKDGSKTFTQKVADVSKSLLGEMVEENVDQVASNTIDILHGIDKDILTTEEFLTTSVLSGLISVPGAYMESKHKVEDSVVLDGVIKAASDQETYNTFIDLLDNSEQDDNVKESKKQIVDTIKNNFEVFDNLSEEGQRDLAKNLWNKSKIGNQLSSEGLDDEAKSKLQKELDLINKDIKKSLKLTKGIEASGSIATTESKASQEGVSEIPPTFTEEEKEMQGGLFDDSDIDVEPDVDEKPKGSRSQRRKEDFVDNNVVNDEEFQTIEDKIVNNEQLSDRERAIYDSNSEVLEQRLKDRLNKEENVESEFDKSTNRQSLDGQTVNYKGEEGVITVDENGVYHNGTLIESALNPNITNAELGISEVAQEPTQNEQVNSNEEIQTTSFEGSGDKPLVVKGAVKEFGKVFQVESFNYDKEGNPTEVIVRNGEGKRRKLKSKKVLSRVPKLEKQQVEQGNTDNYTIGSTLTQIPEITEQTIDNETSFTPSEQADFDISLEQEEQTNLENELSEHAIELNNRLNYGEFGMAQNSFTEPFDDGRVNKGNNPIRKKGNASALASALLDGKVPKAYQDALGKDVVKYLKEKAKRWRELSSKQTPTQNRKRRAEGLKQERKQNVQKAREASLERQYPGITRIKQMFQGHIENVLQALQKFNIGIQLHETPKSYQDAVRAFVNNPTSQQLNSGGFYDPNGDLHINPYPQEFRPTTVYHEAAHAVFTNLFNRKSKDAIAIHQVIKEVLENSKSDTHQKLALDLQDFIERYNNDPNLRGEEFFAELVGWLAANESKISIGHTEQGAGIVKRIKQAINKILKDFIGISFLDETNTLHDVIHLVNDISRSLSSGKDITSYKSIKNILGYDPSLVHKPEAIDFKFSLSKHGEFSKLQEDELFYKGLDGKFNTDGTRKIVHSNKEGLFFSTNKNVANSYGDVVGITLPKGTTIEVVDLRSEFTTFGKDFRNAESEAIDKSSADVVKLITIDSPANNQVQYVLKNLLRLEEAVRRNGGNPMSKTFEGKPSKLYQSLLRVTGSPQKAEFWKTQIYSDKFKSWFGDWQKGGDNVSKVVDENGEPQLVYHGTETSGIEQFKNRLFGYRGVYFTDSLPVAKTYGHIIIPSFLSTKDVNELDIDGGTYFDNDELVDDFIEDSEIEGKSAFINNFVDPLNPEDFIGAEASNVKVIFDFNQVKSFNNNGNFSKEDNRIKFSLGRKKINRDRFINNFQNSPKGEQYQKAYPNPNDFYSRFKADFDKNGVTLRDIQRLYAGLDPNKTREQYFKEAKEKRTQLKQSLKRFGFSNEKVNAIETIYGETAKRWSKETGRGIDEFWSDTIDKFVTIDKAKENADQVKRKIIESLPFSQSAKYRRGEIITPFEIDKATEQLGLDNVDKGAMLITDEGKAIIYITSDADVKTPTHELAHIFEYFMQPEDRQTVLKWSGKSKWSTQVSEMFARGFDKYLDSGLQSDNNKLTKVFKKFSKWLKDIIMGPIYRNVPQLNHEMTQVYNKMFYSEINTGQKYDANSEINNNASQAYSQKATQAATKKMREDLEIFEDPSIYENTSVNAELERSHKQYGHDDLKIDNDIDKVHSEMLKNPKSVGSFLSPELFMAATSALGRMKVTRDALTSMIQEAKDLDKNTTSLEIERQSIDDKIFKYHEVLDTAGSVQGLMFRLRQIAISLNNYSQESAKTKLDELGVKDKKKRSTVEKAYETVNKVQNDLIQEQNKQNEADIDEIFTTYDKNGVFRFVAKSLNILSDDKLVKTIKDSIKTIVKNYNSKASHDSSSDPIEKAANVIAMVMDPQLRKRYFKKEGLEFTNQSITSFNELVEMVKTVDGNITEQVILDTFTTLSKSVDSARLTIDNHKTQIKQEVNLLNKIGKLFNITTHSGTRKVSFDSDNFKKLKELQKQMIKVVREGRLDNVTIKSVYEDIQKVGAIYEGVLIGKIVDAEGNVLTAGEKLVDINQEDVKKLLTNLDKIEARLYLAKHGEIIPELNTNVVSEVYGKSVKDLTNDEVFSEAVRLDILPEGSTLAAMPFSIDQLRSVLGTVMFNHDILYNEDSLNQAAKDLGIDFEKLTFQQIYERVRELKSEERMGKSIKSLDEDIERLNNMYSSDESSEVKMEEYMRLNEKYNMPPQKSLKINKRLQELNTEYLKKKRDLQLILNNLTKSRFKNFFDKLVATPKVLVLALDFSYIMYQGVLAGSIHPIVAAKLIPKVLANSVFDSKHIKYMEEFQKSGDFVRAKYYGVKAFGVNRNSFDEELQWQTLFDNLPIAGDYTKFIQDFSNRGYSTFMEGLRVHMFTEISKGVTNTETLQHIAEKVNKLTGAASKFGSATSFMNDLIKGTQPLLTAPRLYVSSFMNMFDVGTFGLKELAQSKLSKDESYSEAKRISAAASFKASMSQLAFIGVGLALYKALQPEDEDDWGFIKPFSPDFGKLKIGQTRLTVSPFVSYADAMLKVGGKVVNYASSGKFKPENASKNWEKSSVFEVFNDEFLKYRWNPLISGAKNMILRRDFLNRYIPDHKYVENAVLPSVLPIPVTGFVKNVFYEDKGAQAVPELGLDLIGVNTYTVNLYYSNKMQDYFKDRGFNLVLTKNMYPDGIKDKSRYDPIKETYRNEVKDRLAKWVVDNNYPITNLKRRVKLIQKEVEKDLGL